MARTATIRSEDLDLLSCDREPIQIPGSIQPFGVLLVLDETSGTVLQVSQNVEMWLGRSIDEILGRSILEVFQTDQGTKIGEWLTQLSLERTPLFLGFANLGIASHNPLLSVVAHRINGVIILELEEAGAIEPTTLPTLNQSLRTFVAKMEQAATAEDLCELTVGEFRRLMEFDRILIYRFDEDGNGTVVAEARNGEKFPSLLDHRFPASDIPKQARELYRLNRVRLIADAGYTPVPIVPTINPKTNQPLDLTYSSLRSVSPIHVEYMRNMKTAASMSFSILRDGLLWGLLSCHHATPKVVSYETRATCEFLSQIFSLQHAAKERYANIASRIQLKSIEAKLLASMAKDDDFVAGLASYPDDLLRFASASGAALVFESMCRRIGETPEEQDILRLVKWLAEEVGQDIYATESLVADYPAGESFKDRGCGILAITISKLHGCYLLWFRPEVIRTIKWGGDPRKSYGELDGRIHPRQSFEMWKETVRNRALPWDQNEIETAVEFRSAIVEIVLRRAEELAQLNAELKRSNRELEAFSYSVSHDLRAPFRHIVGYSELLREESELSDTGRRYVDTIIESAQYAGTLVDNLLAFSHIGRTAIHPALIDMTRMFQDVRREVMAEAEGRTVEWQIADLPPARCDPMIMRLAVRNLLSNAIKYTRKRDVAKIEVGSETHDHEVVYFVRDNGTGFDMRYVEKLFGVFQRLHRMEDFEGTGIGLANVRRIVERHGGRTWAEGALDVGATFFFTLPRELQTDNS